MPTKPVACQACRVAKRHCDGPEEGGCPRCRTRNSDCVPQPSKRAKKGITEEMEETSGEYPDTPTTKAAQSPASISTPPPETQTLSAPESGRLHEGPSATVTASQPRGVMVTPGESIPPSVVPPTFLPSKTPTIPSHGPLTFSGPAGLSKAIGGWSLIKFSGPEFAQMRFHSIPEIEFVSGVAARGPFYVANNVGPDITTIVIQQDSHLYPSRKCTSVQR